MKKRDQIIIKHSLFPLQEFEEEEESSWQVSYLDIITIVLGFLIILLAVSQITKTEFSSLSELFGKFSDETEFFTTPIGNIQDELFTLLEPEIDAGNLEIIRDLNDLKIRFNSDYLYSSGEARLQPDAEYLLDRVLIAMQQLEYNDFNIDVEGHTDNNPISSVAYPSNWELSTARAANVVKYFNDLGIESKRLKASGYADSRPVIQYDSLGFPFAASKEQNRRVVLRLYYTTENLLEERQDELAEETTNQVEVEDQTPESNEITTPVEEDIVVLADQPAIVTLIDQNRIDEAQREASEQAAEPNGNDANETESVRDESTQDETTLQPETEPTPLQQPIREIPTTPEPEPEPEIIPVTNNLPSLLRVDARCQFAVRLGEYDGLQTAFQQAARIETAIAEPVILTFNNEAYSIRTAAISSFSDAISKQSTISSQLSDSNVSLVHQCYNNTINRPKPVKYLIQFGAFQDRTNGLNFTMELFDQYNVQAYMNRVSDTYNILTGPYTDRNEVLTQLRSFRELGITSNLFIRHQPETAFDYQYAYQIQVNSFSDQQFAETLAQQVRSESGVNTRVEELTSGQFFVMTGQSISWDETRRIFNLLQNSVFNTEPVIFVLEYTP